MTPTITVTAPDQSGRALGYIRARLPFSLEANNTHLARLIAAAFHLGPTTAMYAFAATGDLDADRLRRELDALWALEEEQEDWADWLGRYALRNGGRS